MSNNDFSISKYIIWLDDMRKLCFQTYETWKANQKLFEKSSDFTMAKYCKEEANIDWDRFRNYDKRLARIGIYTGTQEPDDWKPI